MTTIQLGDKKLIIEDGCNVEVGADEVRVKPALPAIQWMPPLPLWPPLPVTWPPSPPATPIYPQPWRDATASIIYQGPTWMAQTGNYN